MAAGSRFGKSILAAIEALYVWLHPNTKIWLIGTQYNLADKEFTWALTFLYRLTYNGLRLVDLCKLNTSDRGSKKIEAPWGSIIETKSTEKPTLLLGDEIDFAIMCEASQHSTCVYERYIRRALGPREGGCLFPSTPNGDNGIFQTAYNRGLDPNEPLWESWLFSVLANPTFSRNEYELAKKELNPKIFEEQYGGKFVSRRGLVFDLSLKNIEELVLGLLDYYPFFVAIDYKPNNPISVTYVVRKDEEYIVVGEIYDRPRS